MRYAFTKGLILLLVPFCTFSQNIANTSQNNENTPEKVYNLKDYLLAEDTKLVLDSEFGDTFTTVRIDEKTIVDKNESDDFHYIQKLEMKEDGIYLLSADQHVNIFLFFSKNMETTYPNPPLQLPIEMNIGDSWKWETIKVEDGDSVIVNTSGKVESEELLVLESGEYKTIKILFDIETSEGEKSRVTQWLAPNLGRIKMNVQMEGGGFIGTILSLLGYDEIEFTLKEVEHIEVANK